MTAHYFISYFQNRGTAAKLNTTCMKHLFCIFFVGTLCVFQTVAQDADRRLVPAQYQSILDTLQQRVDADGDMEIGGGVMQLMTYETLLIMDYSVGGKHGEEGVLRFLHREDGWYFFLFEDRDRFFALEKDQFTSYASAFLH